MLNDDKAPLLGALKRKRKENKFCGGRAMGKLFLGSALAVPFCLFSGLCLQEKFNAGAPMILMILIARHDYRGQHHQRPGGISFRRLVKSNFPIGKFTGSPIRRSAHLRLYHILWVLDPFAAIATRHSPTDAAQRPSTQLVEIHPFSFAWRIPLPQPHQSLFSSLV